MNISFKNFYLLNEVSEKNLQKIVTDIEPKQLPFNNIFGDKYRLDEEFDVIDENVYRLEEQLEDYTIDIKNKTIKRKNSNNSQKLTKFITRQYREIFNRAFEEIKKNFDFESLDPTGFIRKLFPVYAKENNLELPKADNNYQNRDWMLLDQSIRKKEFEKFSKWVENLEHHKNLKSILYNNSNIFYKIANEIDIYFVPIERYIMSLHDNITNIFGTYHIIYSRHPLDILRMSDFEAIQSCHSQGGGYFQCAIQEANEGGIIAYLVNDNQYKNIEDLQSDEIFTDKERGITGVYPDSRIRIRHFRNLDTGESLLIPEERVYGKNVGEGFRESVVNWTKKHQTELINQLESEGNIGLGMWELVGGYYEDTSSSSLFEDYLDVETWGDTVKYDEDGDTPLDQVYVWQEEAEQFYEIFKQKTNKLIEASVYIDENAANPTVDLQELNLIFTNINPENYTFYVGEREVKIDDYALDELWDEFFSRLINSFNGIIMAYNLPISPLSFSESDWKIDHLKLRLETQSFNNPDELFTFYQFFAVTVYSYFDEIEKLFNEFYKKLRPLYSKFALDSNIKFKDIYKQDEIQNLIAEITRKFKPELKSNHNYDYI